MVKNSVEISVVASAQPSRPQLHPRRFVLSHCKARVQWAFPCYSIPYINHALLSQALYRVRYLILPESFIGLSGLCAELAHVATAAYEIDTVGEIEGGVDHQ